MQWRVWVIGEVEFFEDVLSDDHLHVDPDGVEVALITASCVDYSSAGGQAGLNGTRGWQVVDSPRTLLHFRDLLVTIVENVWGWIELNEGSSFAIFCTAMRRLKHTVHPPQRLNSRHLGMAIQSERAFVFTNRSEFDEHLGEPRRLDEIRMPKVPMRRKLLPIAEVLRRRSECEIALVPGSFRPCRVQQREFGPIKIGDAEFASRTAGGVLRPGARVRLADFEPSGRSSGQTWRVLFVAADGRLKLRSGSNVVHVRPKTEPVVEPFRIDIFSIDGQAFRVTASDVAEPPLFQSKAAYCETRGVDLGVKPFYRILLAGDGWSLMEKPLEQARLWKVRAAEEQADSMLPKTVPPFTSSLMWLLTGNSIATRMAALGVGELHVRWSRCKELLSSGMVVLSGDLPATPDALYDDATLAWRRRTRSKETFVSQVPQSYGIDDSHLNVALKARRLPEREPESLSVEDGEAALGYLRAFAGADSRPFCDGASYEASSSEGSLGAERRPARSRAAPMRLEPAPTMRGGARSWRERMTDVEVDPAVSADMAMPAEAAKRGRSAVRVRGAVCSSSSGVVAKPPRVARKSASARSVAEGTVRRATSALEVENKAQQPSRAEPSRAEPSRAEPTRVEQSRVEPNSAEPVRVAPLVHGPVRPPPKKKSRPRKKGLALLPLEGADLFRKGDWNNIEAFASTRMPMFSVAWATLKGYESCWKHWVSFQYYAQLDIFVEVASPATRRRTATWMLSFVALLAYAAGYKASTIKKCLMAIRFFHLAHEYDNPLEKLPRVWQAYRAVKRHQGPTERKHPITPEMCEWIDAHQRTLGAAAALQSAIKRAARYIAIYLGCRCSEYLGPDIHWEKIILVSCVRPMKGDAYCNWEDDFDGVMVTFRGSKTDQFNLGCKRYVGKAGNSKCAIAAFHDWFDLQPGHFRPENGDTPMFMLPSGHVLGRNEMQNDFRLAAKALDLPTEKIGTHSCRVSCATWLYQAGYGIEFIKRHARWLGNSVHVYLWEGSGLHGMIKDMSEVKFKLHLHIV